MYTELPITFGGLSASSPACVEKMSAFLDALPRLSRGLLTSCDLTVGSHVLECAARFRLVPAESMLGRLQFWAWQAGGALRVPSSSSRTLERLDSALLAVEPTLLPTAAASLLSSARLGGRRWMGSIPPPRLALHLPLSDMHGLVFDGRQGTLFVPSPLAPPVGDDVPLVLHSLDGEYLPLEGVVTGTRAAGGEGPGSPAGFVLALVSPEPRVTELLESHAGRERAAKHRRGPRYLTRARVRISVRSSAITVDRGDEAIGEAPEPDYVENLSQGGAFIGTAAALDKGTSLLLEVTLPGGSQLRAPAEVVYRNARGLGVRFRCDAPSEALLAAAIERLSLRQRRALIVDDDALARRMLGDALAVRGFEVYAADDGISGLQELGEQLLGMDVVLTDVRMPNMGGEEFIRNVRAAGGGADVAILAVTGSLDPVLEGSLQRAGADLVLDKADGPDRIGEAVDEVLAGLRKAALR